MRVSMSQLFSRNNENLQELCVRRDEDKISTELDGETVILDIPSGMYSSLDPVGTTIWNLLETPVAFRTIVGEILNAYDVSEEQCITDVLDFLHNLSERGLIVVMDAEQP